METSSASAPALATAAHSPKGWEQIEDPDEVARILEKTRQATRFDVYRCAELYELAYPGYEGDRDFYLEQGRAGRVLYLGAGAGRIFGSIAEQNPAALGLDNSPEMLDLLRRRHPGVARGQMLLADAVQAPLPEAEFDTVIAPYSFLQVVTAADLPGVLQNVHRWLRPGGRFLTDTFSPYLIPFRQKGLEASIRAIGAQTRVAIYILYDHAHQDMTEWAFIDRDGDEQVLEMRLHYYFPQELTAAFERAGFAATHLSGGFRDEPFDPSENEVLLFVAVKGDEAASATAAHTRNGHSHALRRVTP
jgi:SAM-dependent methyltransferase